MRNLTMLPFTTLLLLATHCNALQATRTDVGRNTVADYATHWENLLLEEYQERASELRDRRKTWSRRRLEESGISIFGASAEPESEVFGEKIVRVYKQRETRFRDRFTRGDVLVMTPVIKTVEPIPRECLVVDVGKDWLTVGVGSSWPEGLWEARKVAGFFQVRLDRTAPQAPLRAQRNALDLIRQGKGGKAATLLSDLFSNATDSAALASQAPSRFENLELEECIQEALSQAKKATAFRPNKSQQYAITWALQQQISLIRGPPGTGKTRVAALLVSTALRLAKSKAERRILAVTHSNGAADVLLEALLQMGVPAVRLGRPASVSPNVQHRTVVAMTEKMPQVASLRQRVADTSLDSQIRSAAAFDLKQCVHDVQKMIKATAPVVVTSCIGANQLFEEDNEDGVSFPTVILDEAAQTTEPALLCALAASKAEQVILVGDTRQLPPTITSMGLRDSLGISPMARLEECGIGETTLRIQYRMPPALLEHPSKYFYKGRVRCAHGLPRLHRPPPKGFPWRSLQPLAFVQIGNSDSEVVHSFGGRSNPAEAQLVASIVADLIAAGEVDASKIAVISPYSKQVQLIRNEIASANQINRQKTGGIVQVGTVDSFQGQETDVVVFSAVRSNPMNELGFLRDSRRLCVAITRARRGLILVGDSTVLKTCRHWAALLDSCESRDCYLDAKDLEESQRKEHSSPLDLSSEHGGKETAIEDELKDLFDDENDELYGLFVPSPNNSQQQ